MEPFTRKYLQEISNPQSIKNKRTEEEFKVSISKILELAKKGLTYAFVQVIPNPAFRNPNRLEEEKKYCETFVLPLYKKQFSGCDITFVDLPSLSYTQESVLEYKLQIQLHHMKNNTLTALYTYEQFNPKDISRYIYISWN